MILIEISKIHVPTDRHRAEFEPEAMAELTGSIDTQGLMHPIIVTHHPGGWELIAGERRLRAKRDLDALGVKTHCGDTSMPEGKIAATLFSELDGLAKEELQLDENIKRRDLTLQERCAAIARLHTLREKQAARLGEKHTVKDTALEVTGFGHDRYLNDTRKAIIVAKHLDHPLVARAKTLDEAIKVIRKDEEMARNEALAIAVGRGFSSGLHTLVHADCREWMKDQPSGQFDCCIVDPPYGIGADEFGDSGGRIDERHSYADDSVAFGMFITNLADISRLCKPASHIYIFCDIDRFGELKTRLRALGWTPFRTPLVMHKVNSGRVPIPDFGPRRQYELVCYAYRGGKPVVSIKPDVFATIMDELVGHGAQKPVDGYTDLLSRSCRAGEKVFDPYCGSGTVFVAATQLRLYATGIEIDAAAYGVAVKRLGELK